MKELTALRHDPDEFETIKIDLEVGSIKGKIDIAKPSGKHFASFNSIPYAEPPIDSLRFRAPLKHSGWQVLFFRSLFKKQFF